MSCGHDEATAYIACVHCDMEHSARQERERIIALLETLKIGEACCDDCQPHADRNRHYLTSVIALIKGETE
jgi:hypothetical protein